jgi:hypothetical protein
MPFVQLWADWLDDETRAKLGETRGVAMFREDPVTLQ